MGLSGIFKLSPALAIKYFKGKDNKATWDWYEMWEDAHQKSFTVAKAMREDVLNDIRTSLDKALSEGKTFESFKKELKPTLQKKGWWGEQIVVDSNGVAEVVQLGSNYRLKTIYSVNIQTAYQTGRYKTQMDNVDSRPYLQYVSVLDKRTRPEHAQLHDLVFRYDDPFWDSFYPPNGWRCRCRVRALSDYKLKAKKIKPDNSDGRLSTEDMLVSKKSGEYKPVTVYTDPLTTKRIAPDVGWSHNPASGLVKGN
ncbi:MAG: phage minor head protein [Candidatus Gastranaerophilales bacterium]